MSTALPLSGAARERVVVVWADDDADDRFLAREAAAEGAHRMDLRFVRDGVELLSYLRREDEYADPASSPAPGLVLLDLNMPRIDGREALRQIKADPALRRIPVVVVTTSRAEEDVLGCYRLGAAAYLVKPVSFEGLVEAIEILAKYWTEMVRLP